MKSFLKKGNYSIIVSVKRGCPRFALFHRQNVPLFFRSFCIVRVIIISYLFVRYVQRVTSKSKSNRCHVRIAEQNESRIIDRSRLLTVFVLVVLLAFILYIVIALTFSDYTGNLLERSSRSNFIIPVKEAIGVAVLRPIIVSIFERPRLVGTLTGRWRRLQREIGPYSTEQLVGLHG